MKMKAKKMIVLANRIKAQSESALKRTWYYDRSEYLNASDAGKCIRQIYYERLNSGTWTPNGIKKRGTVIEKYIADHIRPHSLLVARNDDRQFFFDNGTGSLRRVTESGISGNPDFICFEKDGDDNVVIVGEIKSITASGWKELSYIDGPLPDHQRQLEANMALYKTEGKEKVIGLLIYIDCSDYDRILEFSLPEMTKDIADEIRTDLAERHEAIRNAKQAEDLLPEGKLKAGYSCKFCEYRNICQNPKTVETEEIAIPEENSGILCDYRTTLAAAADLNEKAKKMRADILSYLPPCGDDYTIKDIGGYTAQRKTRPRAGGLSKELLTDDGIDWKRYQKPPTEYSVLTVTAPEDKNDN